MVVYASSCLNNGLGSISSDIGSSSVSLFKSNMATSMVGATVDILADYSRERMRLRT